MLLLHLGANAQLVVSDPTTAALVLKSNAIQATISSLSNISIDKIGELGRITKDVYDISREYRDELKAVSSFVAKTSAVGDIFAAQKRIVDLYSNNITRYDQNLDQKQKEIFRRSMKGGVTRSLNYLKDLDVVISPNFSKMTDAERLKLIGDIKARMDKEHEGMDAVNTYFMKYYNHVEIEKGTYKYLY